MAIPQAQVIDLSSPTEMAINSQRYMADSFAKLGASISTTIAEKRAREEAQAMAPIMVQQYKEAYGQILAGNPGDGIAQLMSIGGGTMNPLILRQKEQAMQAGLKLTNYELQGRTVAQRQAAMDSSAAFRDRELNIRERGLLLDEEREKRLASQPLKGTGLNPNQELERVDDYAKAIREINNLLKNPDLTEEEYDQLVIEASDRYNAAKRAGLEVSKPNIPEYQSKEDRDAETVLKDRLKTLKSEKNQKKTKTDTGWFGMGGRDIDEAIKETEQELRDIQGRRKKSVIPDAQPKASQQQSAPTPQGEFIIKTVKRKGTNEYMKVKIYPDGTWVEYKE